MLIAGFTMCPRWDDQNGVNIPYTGFRMRGIRKSSDLVQTTDDEGGDFRLLLWNRHYTICISSKKPGSSSQGSRGTKKGSWDVTWDADIGIDSFGLGMIPVDD